MGEFLIFCLLAVAVVIVVRLRDRVRRLEEKIAELTSRFDLQSRFVGEIHARIKPMELRPEPKAPGPTPPQPEPEPELVEPEVQPVAAPPPPPPPLSPRLERPAAAPAPVPAPAPARSGAEWEALLGGNWLNKIGVFVLVVGIALALGYSFTQFGPAGRVSIGIAASLAMLVGGAVAERRERYQIFARGLLGGGWAALYVTVYAMHAVEAAKVIDSATAGAALLLAVAAGMIVHSLRYRSQTVTGLAYFVAFATLAITETARLPFLALVPLAGSLLYVAHRFAWLRMTLLGLIATYAVVVWRGDTGSPLWEAQTIFAIYWLLFEAYDILHPEAWLLPLNAAGALGLSILKWQNAAPDNMWMLLACAAGVYLASALLRIRSHKWHGAATLTAALAAGAIFEKLDHQWIASALVVEAELFYLAGVRLRVPYLRWLGTALFGVEAVRLIGFDVWSLAAAQWAPVAALDAAIFYLNRALYASDVFYGYAAAAMAALVIGGEVQEPYRSVAWQAAAVCAFAFGWWRRLFDFRLQGYALLAVGLAGTAAELRELQLSVAAGVCYAGVLCGFWPGQNRLTEEERTLLRVGAGGLTAAALMALIWKLAPGDYLGVAWMALALLVLELGMWGVPDEFRRMSYLVAAIGAVRIVAFNVAGLENQGAWPPRLMPVWAALLAYAISWRARHEEDGVALAGASSVGLVFSIIAAWALLPVDMVAAAWAAGALALLLAARQWNRAVFAWQSYVTAALGFGFALMNVPDLTLPVWTSCLAIALLYAAQLVTARGSYPRLYFSLMATTLTTLLLGYRISGSMLTVACGTQGVILLVAGFPLSDRVLRISGLVLLLSCILKLFVWDLRHLETLPRIFSFIVLGMILLAVSWIYTRFRERVAKYL